MFLDDAMDTVSGKGIVVFKNLLSIFLPIVTVSVLLLCAGFSCLRYHRNQDAESDGDSSDSDSVEVIEGAELAERESKFVVTE